ncbi:MAG: hypothetical protein UX18_C0002G0015 [Candidatus Azambacteria bacterium GW2011_GWC2_45_7b]|uniref:Uncharacterized protein n=1 Tax=Candidatus Azambacteria bacterium GW2011_GWC2_45_7b TaxID=1618621 RepID=A0A837IHF3_9BACT|nr:MAG: hypothetical protein UW15_C0029G0002 [Parcubacteria group bacterium GW2011_GWC1_44_10]KKU13094.1 MAG: hypothetical protein UX18_C0002G0015 [Candidatus Azambacteria bacterium GW2011_GWC2_45_7b]
MKYYLASGAFYAGSAIAIALGYKLITFVLFMTALYIVFKSPFFNTSAQR